MSESLQPFDLHRMFIGDLPLLFTAEVIVRTVIVYLFALALVRLIRRRAVGQLSVIEFLLVIALGSAVGDPMFYPEVPLVHAFAVITVVVFLNRGVTWLIQIHERTETFIEGVPRELVDRGRIRVRDLDHGALGIEKLHEMLRSGGITHLGQVRRAYLEQNGHLSLFRFPPSDVRPGLRIEPPWDLEPPSFLHQGMPAPDHGLLACERCGDIHRFTAQAPLPPCPHCAGTWWADGVVVPDPASGYAGPAFTESQESP